MNQVFLLLGSNEGDRIKWLKEALNRIELFSKIVRTSSIYETAAWGLQAQPDFLNIVIEISTVFSAEDLLSAIQQIEKDLGRQRLVKWGQRTLDIDILFYNNHVIATESLKVPHPYLQDRRFTLEPLNEIAETFVHPVFQKNIKMLLDDCKDNLIARRAGTLANN